LSLGCPRVDRAWFQRLNLTYDEALSDFAFDVNLWRYNKGFTALCYAAEKNLPDSLKALVDFGAVVDHQTGQGQGLPLLHFSIQLKPFLSMKPTQNHPRV